MSWQRFVAVSGRCLWPENRRFSRFRLKNWKSPSVSRAAFVVSEEHSSTRPSPRAHGVQGCSRQVRCYLHHVPSRRSMLCHPVDRESSFVDELIFARCRPCLLFHRITSVLIEIRKAPGFPGRLLHLPIRRMFTRPSPHAHGEQACSRQVRCYLHHVPSRRSRLCHPAQGTSRVPE